VTVAPEPEPKSVKPVIAAPEPAAAIAAPAPEPYLVETLEPATAGIVVGEGTSGEEEESFSLDLPAFGSLKKLLNQADVVAKTHPVVARLRKVVEEDASAGLVEPGTDLSAFIRA
jgi:type IV secretion system protein VirD4